MVWVRAGMLLNLQSRYIAMRTLLPERANLMEALHVAGLGAHTACFSAAAVRELQVAEFPSDALWMDRIQELDVLVSALKVGPPFCLGRSSDPPFCLLPC